LLQDYLEGLVAAVQMAAWAAQEIRLLFLLLRGITVVMEELVGLLTVVVVVVGLQLQEVTEQLPLEVMVAMEQHHLFLGHL
jgi:hypothetical protein